MIGRIAWILHCCHAADARAAGVRAQDVPGIEICTVEKTMERRTSCLQSNVDFLQKTITKLSIDHQQKLDAANRQIEALKARCGAGEDGRRLQTAQKRRRTIEEDRAPPAKDAAPRQRMARSSAARSAHDTLYRSMTSASGS